MAKFILKCKTCGSINFDYKKILDGLFICTNCGSEIEPENVVYELEKVENLASIRSLNSNITLEEKEIRYLLELLYKRNLDKNLDKECNSLEYQISKKLRILLNKFINKPINKFLF